MSYNGADLIFPHLNIVINHLPNHISLFGRLDIAYYGIIIGIAMLLALYIAMRLSRLHGENPDTPADFFALAIVSGVIGARIYYVIFRWDYYGGDILKIINIREGGLAIYGGIIAGIIAGILYCRIKHISIRKLMDICLPGVILAQSLGRWGNFFNMEAFGRYTDSLCAMRLKLSLLNPDMVSQDHLDHLIMDAGNSYIQAHPTFLYESVWDFISFLIIYRFSVSHPPGSGRAALLYFILYGTGRFFIEGLRTDQLLIPGSFLPVSQLLSLILVLGSGAILAYRRFNKMG